MDWKDIAGKVIAAGAPAVGGALFGPLGKLAGEVLASTLGVDPTPEAVGNAVDQATIGNPQPLAAADNKWTLAAAEIKAQAEVATAQVTAVNEAIRAEASVINGWWGNWRMVLAWSLAIETLAWPPFIMWSIVAGAPSTALLSMSGLIMTWWGARFGVVGVHVWTGSNERQAIVTGQKPESVVSKIGKALTRK